MPRHMAVNDEQDENDDDQIGDFISVLVRYSFVVCGLFFLVQICSTNTAPMYVLVSIVVVIVCSSSSSSVES